MAKKANIAVLGRGVSNNFWHFLSAFLETFSQIWVWYKIWIGRN
jgi:hypothetical protein